MPHFESLMEWVGVELFSGDEIDSDPDESFTPSPTLPLKRGRE
jgi:hypothetical protein